MRMHRGSSKGAGDGRPPPEPLPLSASATIPVEVELARARAPVLHSRRVAPGTLVREVVRSVGQAPEGSAILVDGVSVPLDMPIERPVRLVVVSTFSGG